MKFEVTEDKLIQSILCSVVEEPSKPWIVRVNGKKIKTKNNKSTWNTKGSAMNALHNMIKNGWYQHHYNDVLPKIDGYVKGKWGGSTLNGEHISVYGTSLKEYKPVLDKMIENGIIEITQDI